MRRPGDTACWNRRQIDQLNAQVDAKCLGPVVIPPRNRIGKLSVAIGRLLGRRSKYYLYLFLRNAGGDPEARAPG